jgi:hypothetical protein
MQKLRLMLILALVAVLDLGGASPPAGAEAFEEFEESVHGRRRLVRLARQPVPPSTDTAVASAAAVRSRLAHHRPLVRAAADAPRRAPSPSPDPASALDDH